MYTKYPTKLIQNSLLTNQAVGAFLIFLYFIVYGITAQLALVGLQMLYFLSSIAFAAFTFYVRDQELQTKQAKKGILLNQIFGTVLVFAYLLVYGVSSVALLSGFQLIFFMSSYIFAMSIFYIRDPQRIEKQEAELSVSNTNGFPAERNPVVIPNNDLSWFIREANSSLSVIVGFCELLLKREYSESEKEYMMRNIYEQSIRMSGNLSKVSSLISDSETKPKEVFEVVDLLADKNFK